MENSSFINFLRSLDKKELKAFARFVESPYFNTSKSANQLFKEICPFYPDFTGKDFTNEYLFYRIYGNKNYNAVLFRKNLSILLNLAEEYLIVNNNPFRDYSLLHGLLDKKLLRHFKSHIKKVETGLITVEIKDDIFRRKIFYMEELLNYYAFTDAAYAYESGKMALFEIDTLLYFYRLTLFSHRQTGITVNQKEDALDFLMKSINIKQLYEELDKSDFGNKKIFKFLLSIFLLQKTGDEKLYFEIKQFTFSYSEKFYKHSPFFGFHYLEMFASNKIAAGDRKYVKERYEIYRKKEYQHYDLGNFSIRFVDFDNFFKSALTNDDVSWAKHLIEKYVSGLEKKRNKGLGNYYNAQLLFHEKEYDEAFSLITYFNLSSIAVDEFFLSRELRTLMLQIYFEKGLTEDSRYLIDSFYRYLNDSKKLNEDSRTGYLNFIKFYKELIRIITNENYINLNNFKKNVLTSRVNKKSWLIEKIDDLLKRQVKPA